MFSDPYSLFRNRFYLQLSPHCPKMNKSETAGYQCTSSQILFNKRCHPAVRRVRQGAWSSPTAKRPPHSICKPQGDGSQNSLFADRERAFYSVYGLEKLNTYTYGRQVTVRSDHKPFEVIIKKQPPPRAKKAPAFCS